MSRSPGSSPPQSPERGPKTPQKDRKRKRSKNGLSDCAIAPQPTPASQPVSPSGSELSGIDHALAASRDATPPPRPRKSKWGERKSALSREYIDDSDDDQEAPTSPSKRIPESGDENEAVALERAAIEAEEGDSEDSEVYSDDEVPAYPPTEPAKGPPSTLPLVALSQVSDLPDIPFQAKRKRQRKMNDTEYEIFLRQQVTSEEEAQGLLASRWLSPDDIRRLEATGRALRVDRQLTAVVAIKRGKFLEAEKRAMREHLTTFQAVRTGAWP